MDGCRIKVKCVSSINFACRECVGSCILAKTNKQFYLFLRLCLNFEFYANLNGGQMSKNNCSSLFVTNCNQRNITHQYFTQTHSCTQTCVYLVTCELEDFNRVLCERVIRINTT